MLHVRGEPNTIIAVEFIMFRAFIFFITKEIKKYNTPMCSATNISFVTLMTKDLGNYTLIAHETLHICSNDSNKKGNLIKLEMVKKNYSRDFHIFGKWLCN